jgi:hypothetical protein
MYNSGLQTYKIKYTLGTTPDLFKLSYSFFFFLIWRYSWPFHAWNETLKPHRQRWLIWIWKSWDVLCKSQEAPKAVILLHERTLFSELAGLGKESLIEKQTHEQSAGDQNHLYYWKNWVREGGLPLSQTHFPVLNLLTLSPAQGGPARPPRKRAWEKVCKIGHSKKAAPRAHSPSLANQIIHFSLGEEEEDTERRSFWGLGVPSPQWKSKHFLPTPCSTEYNTLYFNILVRRENWKPSIN